jgi:uncharacterized protein
LKTGAIPDELTPMNQLFRSGEVILVGVVHLRPLPGAPRWQGSMREVVKAAVNDATAFERGAAAAVILENFGDVPFSKSAVPAETVAAMAAVGAAVREAVKLPLGFNVLRNDARAALALCAACDGRFIRVNVHCGAMLTDQGVIEGNAFETVRLRAQLCPAAQIFADVQVKHAVPLGNCNLQHEARDTFERGLADALIVSGSGTGMATDLQDVKQVRQAAPLAKILIGSGVTVENAAGFLPYADGVIVGTFVKRGGRAGQPVEVRRVARLAEQFKIRN